MSSEPFDAQAVRAVLAKAEELTRKRDLLDPITPPASEAADPNAAVKRTLANAAGFQRRFGVAPGIIIKWHHDHLAHMLAPEVAMTYWPACLRCGTIVEGYKVAHDGSTEVEIEAECHGEKSSRTIRKPFADVLEAEPTWLQEVCRLLSFFSPRAA